MIFLIYACKFRRLPPKPHLFSEAARARRALAAVTRVDNNRFLQ